MNCGQFVQAPSENCLLHVRRSPCTWWRWSSVYSKCFLIWWRDERLSVAKCEWPWRIAALIAASSAMPVVFVTPIPFGSAKLAEEVAGSYVPVTCFPWWIWQLPSVYVHSFQPGTFLAKCGLGCVGESPSWLWLRVYMCR